MSMLSQKRGVDTVVEAYVNRREACLRVSDTYGCWARETGPGEAAAFRLYMAALDQEEGAAQAYGRLLRRAGQVVSSTDGRAESLGGAASGFGSR